MRVVAAAAMVLLLAVPLSGCLGNEARTEWAYNATQLDDAYRDGKRGTGITVAVVDTGINVGHPAMKHLRDGNDGNGELIAFRDFIDGRVGVEAAHDPSGHGTHVAGIMSARGSDFGDKLTNGGVDLLGGSPNVQLVVARVCANDENCDFNKIAQAIDWAVNQNVHIISLSLGSAGGQNIVSNIIQDDITRAVNRAIDRGVVVVAAAGNDGPNTSDVSFPARIQGVIAVGAINRDRNVASFSSHGGNNACDPTPVLGSQSRCAPHQKPELVAPGTNILSAWTGSDYVRAAGTSQATPFVSSAIALMLEGRPRPADRDDVYQIKQILMNTALELGGQSTPHDDGAGYGLVRAAAAIRAYGG